MWTDPQAGNARRPSDQGWWFLLWIGRNFHAAKSVGWEDEIQGGTLNRWSILPVGVSYSCQERIPWGLRLGERKSSDCKLPAFCTRVWKLLKKWQRIEISSSGQLLGQCAQAHEKRDMIYWLSLLFCLSTMRSCLLLPPCSVNAKCRLQPTHVTKSHREKPDNICHIR